MDEPSAKKGWLSPAAATLLAWFAIACVTTAVVAALRLPLPSRRVRLFFHAVDIGQHLALGVAGFAGLWLWRRVVVARRWAALLVLWCLFSILGFWTLGEDLAVFASKLAGRVPTWAVELVMIELGALALTGVTLLVGRGPRMLRTSAGLVLGLGLAAANGLVLRGDYPGVHLMVGTLAALSLVVALADPAQSPTRAGFIALACATPLALWAVSIKPPSSVAVALSRSSASIVAPWVARLQRPRIRSWNPSTDPWLRSRRGLPDVPPSRVTLLPKNGIVLLFTADCVRADVVSKHVERFPTLARLRREGVDFAEARSTAPATTQAMASLFTSTLYSELRWANLPGKGAEYFYPHLDPTPRFSERLSAAGVITANVQGLPGISARTGLVRGMSTEVLVPPEPKRFAGSAKQLPVIQQLLRAHKSGPLFLYAHFDDPHAPYDRAGDKGSDFESYLAEIGLVDAALGAVLATVEELGLGDRTAVLFSADHGEAFGEHGSKLHATSLYEEVLRIPLLVKVPGLRPRRIEEPVSLLDLGPTVLDLFGLPAPGHAKGQSLVPLLRGERASLDRPMAFESGRAMRAMLFRDRMKLIQNLRTGSVELYDLALDPGELDNLADARPALTNERLERLEQLFEAHRYDAPGYQLPFAR